MKFAVHTMGSRVFATLMAGILVSMMLSLWVSDRDRQQTLLQLRGSHAVERVAQLVLTLDALPPSDRPHALVGAAVAGLVADLRKKPQTPPPPEAEMDPVLADAISRELGGGRQVSVWRWSCPLPDRFHRRPPGHPPRMGVCRSISLLLADGSPLQLDLRAPPPPPRLLHEPGALPWIAMFILCIGLLAYAVSRMVTRPLRQLAQAANELGRQMERPPLPLSGPTEVQEAAGAFNAMQERIHRHVQERLRMLAAITHDLQTPMTRLRLRLEKVDDTDLRERLIGDLAAMQAMVREGLDLVRTLEAPLSLAPMDLRSLVDSLCEDAMDAGQDARLEGDDATPLLVLGHATTLRRCFGNLLDNALKYGQKAQVSVGRKGNMATVSIRDAGPGIPTDKLEAVFEPFSRLEESRSRDTGGTGLGLTIAREIARRHGGRLSLSNHPQGGLEALVELPLKP